MTAPPAKNRLLSTLDGCVFDASQKAQPATADPAILAPLTLEFWMKYCHSAKDVHKLAILSPEKLI